MSFVTNFISRYGMIVVYAALTAIAGFIGTQLKQLISRRDEDETKLKVAQICVKAVEQLYCSKVWHSNSQYRITMYRCNNKYGEKNSLGKDCATPALRESEIKESFLVTFNSCITNRAEIIKNCRPAIYTVIDTTKLEVDVARLTEECTVVAEMIRKCVDKNAHISVDPQIHAKKYEALVKRYTAAKEHLDACSDEISKRNILKVYIEDFLKTIKKNDRLLTESEEMLWCSVIEKVTVFSKDNIVFRLMAAPKSSGRCNSISP